MGLALLVCDMVIQDKQSNKRSLIGLFDRLFASNLPCIHPQLSVFVSLTSGRGEYDCEVACRHQTTGEMTFSAKGKVTFKDPLQVVELVFNLQGVRFIHEGEHWLECKVEEVPVMMRRIFIVKREDQPQAD
jgi:hypothetical protein